ncbi:hypothetical protein FBEOM_4679 [Fusarium beomiforme]|uniref:Uncharacterized protein n=1 Tax=Fusarium beomiforme TaxID=44412 RepID=A0A9P5AMQ3_9HYPO|nr:hypothetical protein FBEOM_4679 [Fusarium beomiforme]
MSTPAGPRNAGRMGGTILRAFLVLFAITNFITFILSVLTAAKYNERLKAFAIELEHRDILFGKDYDSFFIETTPDQVFLLNPIRFLLSSYLPFLLLAAVAGTTWIIVSLTLLFLLTRIRYFNHRVARYVFRVIAVATFVFLVLFSLTWTTTLSFLFPFAAEWSRAEVAVVIAHINLLLGFFITLLSAVLDIPKDWADPPPTGTNNRLTSQG